MTKHKYRFFTLLGRRLTRSSWDVEGKLGKSWDMAAPRALSTMGRSYVYNEGARSIMKELGL